VAAIEQRLLGRGHLRHQAGLLRLQQLGPALVLRGAHHRGRLGCGEVVGAQGVPLRGTLGYFLNIHASVTSRSRMACFCSSVSATLEAAILMMCSALVLPASMRPCHS